MPIKCAAGGEGNHYTRVLHQVGEYPDPTTNIPMLVLKCSHGIGYYNRFEFEEARRQEEKDANQALRYIQEGRIERYIQEGRIKADDVKAMIYGFYGAQEGSRRIKQAEYRNAVRKQKKELQDKRERGEITERQYVEQLLQARQNLANEYFTPQKAQETIQRIQQRTKASQERFRREGPATVGQRLLFRRGKPLVVSVGALSVFATIGMWMFILFGSFPLLIAFLSLGFYNFFPSSEEHNGLAGLKTALKILIIVAFVWGFFQTYRPLSIVAAFIGYFSLSPNIDANHPQAAMEAAIRMIGSVAIAGMLWSVFGSALLGAITFAFLFVPPKYISRTSDARNRIIININRVSQAAHSADNIIFAVIMVVILIGSGALNILPIVGGFFASFPTWGLTGAFAALFFIYWFVALISGMTSAPQARPYIGLLFIGFAFVAFTFGAGGEHLVGSAFFGQWWPQVYQNSINIIGPIKESFETFAESIGQGISLVTNPTGFAQKIIEGKFRRDPDSGLAGALGVDIELVRATQIRPFLPYSVIVKIRNKGAFDGKNTTVSLISAENVPENLESISSLVSIRKGELSIRDLGFAETEKNLGEILKNEVREIFFDSENTGLRCDIINDFELRRKPLPIVAVLEYDYEIESFLDLEVLSDEEWKKKVQDNLFVTATKKPAILTNSPVKLNLGLPEQPHRASRPFTLEIEMKTAQKRGKINKVYNLEVTYSNELEIESCTEQPKVVDNTLKWNRFPQTGTIFCHFKPVNISTSSKTFVFKAKSNFRFLSAKQLPALVEFGGGCCDDSECLGAQTCSYKRGDNSVGICGASFSVNGGNGGTNGGNGNNGGTVKKPGERDYCKFLLNSGILCGIGEGGCTNTRQCSQNTDDLSLSNICRPVSGVDVSLCCPTNMSDSKCKEIFDRWMNKLKKKIN